MSRQPKLDVVGKVRLYITLPEDLLRQFESYCQRNGMKLSSRIAVLIRKDLEQSARAS
jgi:metal-responsive CopG/Arc/MetJ family transcriptional regulator